MAACVLKTWNVLICTCMLCRSARVYNDLHTEIFYNIVSAARSLTCRDDLDSKWRLLLTENNWGEPERAPH